MDERAEDPARLNQTDRYTAFMNVVRNRMTNRAFAPYRVPRKHFEVILEAARHAPSGRQCPALTLYCRHRPEHEEEIAPGARTSRPVPFLTVNSL